jgi:hypothetical protein
MRRFFARFSIGGRDSPEDTPRSQFQSPKDGDSSPTTSEIDDFFFPHTVSSATESWTPEYASDPTVWEQQFSKHWNVLEDLLSVEHCDKRSLSLVGF